jgi:hypothetical protein
MPRFRLRRRAVSGLRKLEMETMILQRVPCWRWSSPMSSIVS